MAASTSRSAPPNSATAPAPCIARSPRPCWRRRSTASTCANPTPRMAATTPAPMAAPASSSPGNATQAAAEALAGQLKQFAASLLGENPDACTLDNHATVCAGRRTPYALLAASAQSLGKVLSASGNSSGTPRSRRLQRPGLSGRGQQVHRRDQDPEERAGRRRRPRRQSDAVPRPDRRRRRAGAGRGALRGDGDRRRAGAIVNPKIPRLSSAVVCRHSRAPKCSSPTHPTRWDRWAPNR